MNEAANRAGALADLSVVELGEGTAAAFSAKLLGDFGATVIKVERPEGDPTRRRGPFPGNAPDPEASGLFAYLNTNKLGVTADLQTASGQRRLDTVLSTADILVTDLAADLLEAAGCSPAALRQRHPGLVVATVSPFGQGGPWSGRLGDELTAFAASGLAYGTPGIPDAAEDLHAEPPLHPSCFVAETIAGVSTAAAIMSAIAARRRTGEGCHVDLSVQAVSAAVQVRDMMPAAYGGARYNRLLNPVSIGRMPNFYLPCKDASVTLAAPMEVHWKRVIEAMGRPEWALSEKFSSQRARLDNWEELRTNLSLWTQSLTSDELHALGETFKVMIFPFYPISRMSGSDQVVGRSSLVEVEIAGHTTRMPGAPFKMSETPWALRSPAPRLGEHDALVFGQNKRASV